MDFRFDQSSPLYQQLASQLEEMIFTGEFGEGDQVPSTTQLADRLKINPATVLKGMNLLVSRGLLEKKRGRGMFVVAGARKKILATRKDGFYQDYVLSLVDEATKLGISKHHLLELIQRGYQDGQATNQGAQ